MNNLVSFAKTFLTVFFLWKFHNYPSIHPSRQPRQKVESEKVRSQAKESKLQKKGVKEGWRYKVTMVRRLSASGKHGRLTMVQENEFSLLMIGKVWPFQWMCCYINRNSEAKGQQPSSSPSSMKQSHMTYIKVLIIPWICHVSRLLGCSWCLYISLHRDQDRNFKASIV